MYKIDRQSNQIMEIESCSFEELGIKEREHFQEWIAKEPKVLGEELLIIQKEFSGFSDTRERLDLLALDKQGRLVIIENKLDDSGKDVVWQALKYASYCSNLSKENITEIFQDHLDTTNLEERAEEKLSNFFDDMDYEDLNLNKGVTQRIILIAAKFRKEVTSTVLWLLNFKVHLQCLRATPFQMDNELFLRIEQIIPTKDAEDYMIGMAEKAQDEIDSQKKQNRLEVIRKEFWIQLIDRMNTKCDLFRNISPSNYNWISATSGVINGAGLKFEVTKSYARAELYIDRGSDSESENAFIFDELFQFKDEIENAFGGKLEWDRMEDRRACRIRVQIRGNVTDQEQWSAMLDFMSDSMIQLEKAFRVPLERVNKKLKE